MLAPFERMARFVRRWDHGQTGPVFLDVPKPNPAALALALAQDRGLAPVFETARLYTGAQPDIALDRIFGVSSFELG